MVTETKAQPKKNKKLKSSFVHLLRYVS